MVRIRVVALSVTCASAFRNTVEAGLLDVEEAQAHSHGMVSLVNAHRVALLKRLTQPEIQMSCAMILPQMVEGNPNMCAVLLGQDDEGLSQITGGMNCTHADVEATCGTMSCAQGLNAMVDMIMNPPSEQGEGEPSPPQMTVEQARGAMCMPPQPEQEGMPLPAGCADRAAIESTCGACSMMNPPACSQPFSDEPGPPPDCATSLQAGTPQCTMVGIMNEQMWGFMPIPGCTYEEARATCPGPASCAGAMNAGVAMQTQMQPDAPSDAEMRGRSCSIPPTEEELPPQCTDVAAVQALCGGCSNTTVDACAEPFQEPSTTTATTTTSDAKLISLCPMVAAFALLRLW